jgi:translation initiation factor 2 subunit 1
MVSDPDAVLLKLQNDFNDGKPIEVLTEGVRDAIIKNVKRRMTPQPLKIRADVELTCFSYDGVLHIQVSSMSRADAVSFFRVVLQPHVLR